MPDETNTGGAHAERIVRVAWLLSFVVPLVVLLGLMLMANPSEAVTTTLPSSPNPSLGALDGDEEWEEEESEEEWEEAEEEEFETSPHPPDECLLRSVSAHAVAKHQRLKLTIGYTTYEPGAARIEIKSGSSSIGSFRRHLGRSGVLRFARQVGEGRGERVVVQVKPIGGSECPSRRLVLRPR